MSTMLSEIDDGNLVELLVVRTDLFFPNPYRKLTLLLDDMIT